MSTDKPFPCPNCTPEQRCEDCENERRELREILERWDVSTMEDAP